MAARSEYMAGKKAKTEELIKEIIVFRQVMFKMGCDEAAENEKVFVHVLNDFGFRNSYGKELTYMGYRQMMERADQTMIRDFVLSLQHEPLAVLSNF